MISNILNCYLKIVSWNQITATLHSVKSLTNKLISRKFTNNVNEDESTLQASCFTLIISVFALWPSFRFNMIFNINCPSRSSTFSMGGYGNNYVSKIRSSWLEQRRKLVDRQSTQGINTRKWPQVIWCHNSEIVKALL